MAAVDRYDAAFNVFISRYLRENMHTAIRGRVISVDYSGPTVDIQPMAETALSSGSVQRYPPILDVPLQMPSGSGGKSLLSMPVKVGDIVGLTFSERNEDDRNDLNTHQLFPGWAVTQVFTSGNRKDIDPDNVELINDKVKMSMTPEGDCTITTPKSTMKVLQDGTFEFNNGAVTIAGRPDGTGTISNAAGGINLRSNGETDVNGGKITRDGNFITAQGVDLNAFWTDYINHRHGNVQNGGGQTGTKV